MRLPEFLECLKKISLEWSKMYVNKGTIRGGNQNGHFCPITAVVYERTGLYYGTRDALHAGCTHLKLGPTLVKSIIRAADDPRSYSWLRKKLEQACGLGEI